MTKPKTPFYLIDTSHPFYRPLWVRIAISAIAVFWAGLELVNKDMFFVVISLAIAAYCVWVLLITYKAPEPVAVRPPDPEDDEPVEAAPDETPKP